jgi:hypothetical protein
MSWADDRRADKLAAAQAEILKADAAAKRRREDRAADLKIRDKVSSDRRSRLTATRKAATAWLGAHQVHATIALLGATSVVMAVPAMAGYGHRIYGAATGVVLPVLSELGAWAFAFAVRTTRKHHPDRPVWALLLGLWLFATGGAALNVLDGLHRGWDAAVVMGFASIAGIVAHQLVVASPRRSAAERAEARLARAARRKIERARRAAIGDAAASIDPSGQVRLVFAGGEYRLDSRGRLAPILNPDPFAAEAVAIENARRVLGDVADPDPSSPGSAPDRPDDDSMGSSTVGVLDRPGDQRKSRSGRPLKRGTIPPPKRRSIDEIRQQFESALTDPRSALDPTSAESIRKTLGIAPKTARQLRNEHLNPKEK